MKRSFLLCLVLTGIVVDWGKMSSVQAQEAGQSQGLTVEMEPLVNVARSDGPIVVEWTLTWHRKGLLEGQFVYRVYDDPQYATGPNPHEHGRYVVSDIVLSSGVPYRFRTILPSMQPPYVSGVQAVALEIEPRFVTEKEEFVLEKRPVRLAAGERRLFTMGVCDVWDVSISPRTRAVEEALRPERFASTQDRQSQPLSTVTAHITPENWPNKPLELCTFNLAMIAADGLPALDEKQLTALLHWVDAGGSLFVIVGDGLNRRHVEFLNNLFPSTADFGGFFLDEGRLVGRDDFVRGEPIGRRKGIGRVVIVSASAISADDQQVQTNFDSPRWRELICFLWKVRRDQTELVKNQGRFRGNHDQTSLGVRSINAGNSLLEELMPRSVATVPLTTIGIIMGVYVLVIGPVDYFCLGWFKRRKWTWVVFPLVTLGFAGYTVWLSYEKLKSDDPSRSLVFVDVGDEGEIVRVNQFKLLFTNTPQDVEIAGNGSLWTELDHREYGGSMESLREQAIEAGIDIGAGDTRQADEYEYYRMQQWGPYSSGTSIRRERLVDPPTYTGRVPSGYTMTQSIPQWTPQLNRRLEIRPSGYDVPFDWDSLDADSLTTHSGREEAGHLIRQSFGNEVEVMFFHQNQVGFDDRRSMTTTPNATSRRRSARPSSAIADKTIDLLTHIHVRNWSSRPGWYPGGEGEYFSLFSDVSPTGGRHFEDIVMHDMSDPAQWLLLVLVPREDELLIYRKLYITSNSPSGCRYRKV